MGAGMARICARYDESDNLKPPCSDLHTEMKKTATEITYMAPKPNLQLYLILLSPRLSPDVASIPKAAPASAPCCERTQADFDKLNPPDIWQ